MKIKSLATTKLTTGLFALLLIPLVNRAATTNYIVNAFNTAAEVTNTQSGYNSNNGWANWLGGAFQSVSWDATSDASNNPTSGSMKIVANFSSKDYGQYLIFDGFGAMGLNAQQYTNLQFDVRFAPTSALRTNGNGSLDFGYIQIGTVTPTYDQDYYAGFAVPATNALGQPNTNWVHISLTLPSVLADPILTNINDIIFHTINVYYDNTYAGSQTYWLDNIKFIGSAITVSNPPPVLTIQKTTPCLRIFAGSTINTYDREQLATVDQNQSWIGGTYPVTYSFKLLSSANYASFQTHMFLLPVNQAGNNMYANEYIDYQASNEVWLQINGSASGQVTANVAWKTNLPNANPDHVAVNITNATAVGTWTVTFNNATTGTLTAPGAAPVPFTIADPNVVADFTNPLVAYFGIQPQSTTAYGAYVDYANININGVVGSPTSDDFTAESGIGANWNITSSAASSSLVLVTADKPYWVSWTLPDGGFGLGAATAVTGNTNTANPWMLPEYYNNYNDGLNIPGSAKQGYQKWTLIPSTCLPTVDGTPGGTPAPNAFFRLVNPPLTD